MTNLTDSMLRNLLGLSDNVDLAQAFSDLDVDSWDLIETRTILETQFGMNFTDDQWMSMERPADILSHRNAT